MNRLLVCALCLVGAAAINGCSFNKKSPTNESATQPSPAASASNETKASPEAPPPTAPAQAGDLQPGQASGTYTAKGVVFELKYAYAGRAERFGKESIVVLLTEQPIPAEAVAEEIKSATMLEDEKLRGLEYVLDDDSMWVRFHPGQYQESSSNKIEDYKVENGIVSGSDENDGSLTNGRYKRSVKFTATLLK